MTTFAQHPLTSAPPAPCLASPFVPPRSPASIRIHGDFEGSKLRSIATAGALRSLQREYRTAIDREIDLEATADTLIRTARVMSEDLAAWQDLYRRKRLMLPA
jgi:hypothetical protein